MVDAGYNPRGMVDVMEVLAAESRRRPSIVERMFASHPLTENRIATAKAAVAALPAEVLARPMTTRPHLRRIEQLRRSRPAYDRLAEAQQLAGEGRVERSMALLRQSVDEWPEDGVLRGFLAAAELEGRRLRAAASDADRAARDAPSVFFVQVVAGRSLLEMKRYGEALRPLDRAEALLSDVAEVRLLRARALEGSGRRQEAIDEYRRVTQLAPGTELADQAQGRLRILGAL